VDVDDTIMDHNDIPKMHVINALKDAKSSGCKLYLWSQGGAEYCKKYADTFGISYLFSGFLDKPDIVIDDLEVKASFIDRWIHPIQLL